MPRLKLPHARPASRPNFFSFRGSGPPPTAKAEVAPLQGARLPRLKLPLARPQVGPTTSLLEVLDLPIGTFRSMGPDCQG